MTDLNITVEDVAAGKFNTVGCDIIGRCEEKFRMIICLLLNGYRDRAAGIHQYANTVNGNKMLILCKF